MSSYIGLSISQWSWLRLALTRTAAIYTRWVLNALKWLEGSARTSSIRFSHSQEYYQPHNQWALRDRYLVYLFNSLPQPPKLPYSVKKHGVAINEKTEPMPDLVRRHSCHPRLHCLPNCPYALPGKKPVNWAALVVRSLGFPQVLLLGCYHL